MTTSVYNPVRVSCFDERMLTIPTDRCECGFRTVSYSETYDPVTGIATGFHCWVCVGCRRIRQPVELVSLDEG